MSNITKANRDIKSLQSLGQQAAQLSLDIYKARRIDIFDTEYHRSQERQDYLYEQGRTRPGNIVICTKNSNHTRSYVWNIAVNIPHNLYTTSIITKAEQIAKELAIEWGGDWKEKDTLYFQINKDWREPSKDVTYGKCSAEVDSRRYYW